MIRFQAWRSGYTRTRANPPVECANHGPYTHVQTKRGRFNESPTELKALAALWEKNDAWLPLFE